MEEKPKNLKIKTSVDGPKLEDEREEPVSPAARMFQEDATDMSIFCIIQFRNPLKLDKFRSFLKQTLLNHKRFHSIVEGLKGRSPTWVPISDVDMEYHVVEIEVNEDQARSRNPAESCASRLVSEAKLDWSKPLWRAYVANFPNGESRSACIFHIHHSMGDGTSLMSLLLACARQTKDPDLLPTIPGRNRSKTSDSVHTNTKDAPSSIQTKLESSVDAKHSTDHAAPDQTNSGVNHTASNHNPARMFLAMMLNSMIHIFDFIKMLAWTCDSETCIKGGPECTSLERRVASSAAISLSDVAKVQKAVSGTVNDVLLSTIAGGFHLYLKRHNNSNGKGVSKTLLRTLLTVNIRESPGIQELHLMLEKKSKARWGNQLGNILLSFDVDDERNVLDRVRATKRICDAKKNSLEALYTHYNGRIVVALCGAKAISKLIHRSLTQTTFALANMIGPAEEVCLDGNPITDISPTVHGCPQSLVVHMQSYDGKVKFFINAAKKYIPDPYELCECFKEAFDELMDALRK